MKLTRKKGHCGRFSFEFLQFFPAANHSTTAPYSCPPEEHIILWWRNTLPHLQSLSLVFRHWPRTSTLQTEEVLLLTALLVVIFHCCKSPSFINNLPLFFGYPFYVFISTHKLLYLEACVLPTTYTEAIHGELYPELVPLYQVQPPCGYPPQFVALCWTMDTIHVW
jgi:hypothetical protein